MDPFQRLPQSLISHILSFLGSAADVLSCSIVSRTFAEASRHARELVFDMSGLGVEDADEELVVTKMVLDSENLEVLKFKDPLTDSSFSAAVLAAWAMHTSPSLQHLSLHFCNRFPWDLHRIRQLSLFRNLVRLELLGGTIQDEDLDKKCRPLANLQTLSLGLGLCVTDNQLDGLVKLCPRLETLQLGNVVGLFLPVVSSQSLKKLHRGPQTAEEDFCPEELENIVINAPNLRELELRDTRNVVLEDAAALKVLKILGQSETSLQINKEKLPSLEVLYLRGEESHAMRQEWGPVRALLAKSSSLKKLVLENVSLQEDENQAPCPLEMLNHFFGLSEYLKFAHIGADITARLPELGFESSKASGASNSLEELHLGFQTFDTSVAKLLGQFLAWQSNLKVLGIYLQDDSQPAPETVDWGFFCAFIEFQRLHSGVNFLLPGPPS